MDKKIYTIGSKRLGNEIVLPEAHIMLMHARVVVQQNGLQYIEERDRKAFIQVNGIRVKRKVIKAGDEIILGQTRFSLHRYFKFEQDQITGLRQPNDFSEEFGSLRQIYDNYMEGRERIYREARRKDSVFDPVMLIPFAGVLLRKVLHNELGGKAQINQQEALNNLRHEFSKLYRCPNPDCNKPLGEIPWNTLAEQASCDTCRAIWVQ